MITTDAPISPIAKVVGVKRWDTDNFVIMAISDVHFFHTRTKSPRMLSAIRTLFPDNAETGKTDLLLITGDWFDHLVSLNDGDVYYAMEAIRWVLKICKKWDIEVRVLEGTSSHDRRQNILFESINVGEEIHAPMKYVNTLSIEYIERFELNILYLPDEWSHKAEITLEQARTLIQSRGLETVHFAACHGSATYQMPGIVSPAFHDAAVWSTLVSVQIFSGHIHTHSRYLKWMSVGSLERLGHGEEEAKGIVRMTYKNGVEVGYERLINRAAKIYRTLPCYDLDIGEIIALIDDQKDAAKGSAFRLEFPPEIISQPLLDTLKETFPEYQFTELKRGKKKSDKILSAFSTDKFEIVPINPATVKPALSQFWGKKNLDPKIIALSLSLIDTLN